MAAAQDIKNRVRLVSSILKFMNDELKRTDVTPDKAESLEVAIQCLRLAYDVEDTEEVQEPSLLDIYLKAVPQNSPPPVPEENKHQAEELKKQGNEFMKNEAYEKAIEKYTEAIKLDSQSAVYYCNRAAAHTGRGDHESALADCKKAVNIDGTYSKAYSRMGLTYSKMEQYEQALSCYEKALKLDPDNEGYQNNMKIAKEKIQEKQANQMPFPGFGGTGGMSEMLNNPMLMNMAQQFMSDPNMQQMAMNMMNSFMGGNQPSTEANGSEASSQTTPDMSQMLRMGQQFASQISQDNPELVDNLRKELGKGGKSAEGDAQ